MNTKISFIIPAHNEELLIGNALESLACLRREFAEMEVLVGLDGCTDGTLDIVKKYDFVRYFSFSERKGKQEVIKFLKNEAKSSIIVMNDADWQFISNKEEIIKFIACFDDPQVGGIGDYFTTSYNKDKIKTAKNLLYLGDAWIINFVLEYKMKHFTKKIDNKLYVDTGNLGIMFYIHFYRKDAVDEQFTLCDDGERMIQMTKKGYKVRLLDVESRPYLKASYDHIDVKGFFKQRYRGFIADSQIKELYPWFNSGSQNTFIYVILYMLLNIHRVKRIRSILGIIIWWILAFAAWVKFKFSYKKTDTLNGWKLRASRY